jgi:hypothetical protein
MEKVYKIVRMYEFEEKFNKLVKRANKLGVSPPTFKKVGGEYKEFQINERVKTKIWVNHILLEGETPKYNGWSFTGSIENRRDGLRIIHTVPGEEIPNKYRDSGFYCDHCKTNRYRANIYILKDKYGKTIQVGSTCIKDFLGGDSPEDIARYCSYLITADENFDEGGYGGYGREEYRFNTKKVLALTDAAIKKFGWVSKKKEREEECQSTASYIAYILTSLKLEPNDIREASEDNYNNAEKAIEWAKTFEEKKELNDYEYNVLQYIGLENCKIDDFGIVCSIMASYTNYINKRKENKKLNPEYFGEIKKRYTFKGVEVTFVRYLESEWGVKTLIKMVTNDENVLIWFASSSIEIEVGERVDIKGTVKDHREYHGLKETILTRVSFLEE